MPQSGMSPKDVVARHFASFAQMQTSDFDSQIDPTATIDGKFWPDPRTGLVLLTRRLHGTLHNFKAEMEDLEVRGDEVIISARLWGEAAIGRPGIELGQPISARWNAYFRVRHSRLVELAAVVAPHATLDTLGVAFGSPA